MTIKKFPALVFICLGAISAFGQKNYDKPLTEWGQEESLQITKESPWAREYQSTRGKASSDAATSAREQSQSVYSGGSNPRSVARDFGPPPITVRLHSSEILRKAVVRLQQFSVKYDKMSSDEKAKFDAGRKGFLECAICNDYYVVTITKWGDATKSTVDEGVFQGTTLEELKGNVSLANDAGEVRELFQFNAPKNGSDSAVLYFKRVDDSGKHLITKESKEVRLVFKNEFLSGPNRYVNLLPRSFDFKVSKMIVGDKLML